MAKPLSDADFDKVTQQVLSEEHKHISSLNKLIKTYLSNPKKLRDIAEVERAAKLRRLFAGMSTDKTETEHSGSLKVEPADSFLEWINQKKRT